VPAAGCCASTTAPAATADIAAAAPRATKAAPVSLSR
jgi:hypothetical protein